jgi:hypothetical protein
MDATRALSPREFYWRPVCTWVRSMGHQKKSGKVGFGYQGILFCVAMVGLAGAVGSCGKSLDSSIQQTAQQDSVPVTGVGGFGSQCPFGTMGDPTPVSLDLQSCPLTLPSLDLQQPLLPLILQADCKKLEITVRSIDPSVHIESKWKALPDGRFYFQMDAGSATFANDGAGHAGCSEPLVLEVAGLMKCTADRDRVPVQVDATWHIGQTMPGTNPRANTNKCQLPTSCALHGFTSLNQCG